MGPCVQKKFLTWYFNKQREYMYMHAYTHTHPWSHCAALAVLYCYVDQAGLQLSKIYLPLPTNSRD